MPYLYYLVRSAVPIDIEHELFDKGQVLCALSKYELVKIAYHDITEDYLYIVRWLRGSELPVNLVAVYQKGWVVNA